MNGLSNKMLFGSKPYNCKKVTDLIAKDDLKRAIKYMLHYTKAPQFKELNFQLIGCWSRLIRAKNGFIEETVSSEIHNIKLNKLVIHLQRINDEIKEQIDETCVLNEPSITNLEFSNIFKILGLVLLLAMLFLLIVFCYNKIASRVAIKIEPPNRQYTIEDFFITKTNCIDSTYAIIQIKNTGKKDVKNITLKWTPDIQAPKYFLTELIEDLPIGEVHRIKIALKDRNKFAPGVYRSSIEEYHPTPVLEKVFQNFGIIACKKEALPSGFEKGDQAKITYTSRFEKTTQLTGDSISLPANSTSFHIIKNKE